MPELLTVKLHEYLRQNNPEVLFELEEKNAVTQFLERRVSTISDLLLQLKEEKKPAYVIEELCMEELTKDFRPSKFNYIIKVLEEDFESTCQELQKSGTLRFEVINIIAYCEPVFESLKFSEEHEDSRQLRYTVTGIISEYLSK
jgi:hypothetical protein